MATFLQSLPFYQLLILVAVTIVLLSLAAYLLMRAMSRLGISISRKGTTVSSTNYTNTDSLPFLITKVVENIEQQKYIDHIDKTRTAMASVEEWLLSIRKKREENFLKAIRKKSESGEAQNIAVQEDFKHYSFIIEYYSKLLLDKFRNFIHNNGIDDMETEDYMEYVNSKINAFLSQEEEILNNFYFGNRIIDRNELRLIHEDNENEVRKIFQDAFMAVRKAVIRKKREKEDLQKELERLLQDFTDDERISSYISDD